MLGFELGGVNALGVSATLLSPSCVSVFTFAGWLVVLVLGESVVGMTAVCLLCSCERVN